MPAKTILMPAATGAAVGDVLTLDALRKEVYDALGKTSIDWQRGVDGVINDTLAKFANLHNWTWRNKQTTLATVADQEYVLLPTDFMQMTSLKIADTLNLVEITTADRVFEYRQSSRASLTGSFLAALTYQPQGSTTDAPRVRLELFPTPAASVEDQFLLAYRRLLAKLVDASQVPDVPTPFHPLLRQYVRTEAYRADDDGAGFARERQELAAMLPDYMALDGQLQHTAGRIIGPLAPRGGEWLPHNSIGFAT